MTSRPSVKLVRSALASVCAAAAFAGTGWCAAGEVAAEWTRIVQSPRLSAMGEGGAALPGDVLGAMESNPALFALQNWKEAQFSYNAWMEGISLQEAAYAHPMGRHGTLSLFGTMLRMAPFAGYDNSGNQVADVTAGDSLYGISYAGRITGPWGDRSKGLFAGAALKYANQSIDTVSASALLYDVGVLGMTKFGRGILGVGASARSLGGGFQFDAEKDPAPTTYRLGMSYQTLIWGDPLTLTGDIVKDSDMDMRYSAGFEVILWRSLAFRGGYMSGQDLGNGLRCGVGMDLKIFRLDYALASMGKFNVVNRMSIAARFGKPIEVTPHLTEDEEKALWHYERAKKLSAERRYYDAVLELNEALKLDPKCTQALQLMEKLRNMMETLP
ncbi:MAG: PorV/PorQ family protein [Elusimicrobiales bacterium]